MNHLLKLLSRVRFRQLSTSSVGRNTCKPEPDYGPLEVHRSVLMNGIKVAATKTMGAGIASCTMMFQAGSRYEVDDEIGVSHFIRACSSASGYGYSAFNKMRVLQQNGCSITCSTDRQSVAFTLRCPPTKFREMKFYLLDMTRCCYRQWEIDDRRPLVRDDLHRLTPEERVMDLIQAASWAGPLANSMFCPKARVDKINQDIMNCYAMNNFRTDTLTIASLGIPLEDTLKLAELVDCGITSPPSPRCPTAMSSPRCGFAFYDLGRNSETWIALAVPSCGTCNFNSLLMYGVLAAACGTHDMESGHDMDRLLMPPLGAKAGSDIFTQYRAFNISYQETGIFGVLAKTRACSAWDVAFAAAETLINIGCLNSQQIKAGKPRLKLNLAIHDEDCVRVTEGLALASANDVRADSARTLMEMIDNLSDEDISCVAKTLSSKSSAMAMAVVGDVGAVPHNGELVCRRE